VRQRGRDSLHSRLIDAYVEAHPGAVRGGNLGAELAKLFKRRGEPKWASRPLGFIPDAWSIDPQRCCVTLAEVVVTSGITDEKWAAIAELFFDLDAQHATGRPGPWTLFLHQVDRHGVVTSFWLAPWAFSRLVNYRCRWLPLPPVDHVEPKALVVREAA
jgi:hypothetical protein